jgi:methyl-accepting chemotaxis protein
MKNTSTLEKKIDLITERLTGHNSMFENVFTAIEDLSKRVGGAIEDLAVSTKNGFDQVDERFERMDERFDQMDNRFDRIENISIGSHERRIENLEDSVRVLNTKLSRRK